MSTATPEITVAYVANLARLDLDAESCALFQRQIGALLTRPNAHRSLAAISCPTAVIVGRQDAWSPLAQHEEMAALIPHAWLTVIEDCGHMSPVEQPEAVAEALVQWLATEPAQARLDRVS